MPRSVDPSSPRASSTSTSTAGVATTRPGTPSALSGMARALLRRGVTSFLPTAPSLPGAELPRFAERVRAWIPGAPADGAEPLGFNLEGPFLAPARKGAHDPTVLRTPDEVGWDAISAAARRAARDDDRPGAAGGARADRAARGPRGRRVDGPLRVDARRGPGGLRGRRPVDHAPVQRHDRGRPPGARPGGRGADERRGLRRADRRRSPRPSGAVADRHADQAGRPPRADQRRAAARGRRRRAHDDRRAGRGRAGRALHARRDRHARRVGDRARHRGPEPRRRGHRRWARRSPRHRRTPPRCSVRPTGDASRSAVAPTSSSSTTRCASVA